MAKTRHQYGNSNPLGMFDLHWNWTLLPDKGGLQYLPFDVLERPVQMFETLLARKSGASDTNPPVLSKIHESSSGITHDTTEIISGRVKDKHSGVSEVAVFDNGIKVGSATIGVNGFWSWTGSNLADGVHVFTTVATDKAGNSTKPMSAGPALIVDTAAPLLDQIHEAVSGVTRERVQTITGSVHDSGSGISEVQIFDQGVKVGTANVASNGLWSWSTSDLREGVHTFTVVASDAAGNTTASISAGSDLTVVSSGETPGVELPEPYLASPSYTPSLGTNLDGLAYWSTGLPTLDLVKSAGAWVPQEPGKQWGAGPPLSLDVHGWVTSLPNTVTADLLLLLSNAAAPPAARYIVTYTGTGTLQGAGGTKVLSGESTPGHLVVQAADSGSLVLSLTATDPNHTGDYIRDIHVVREDLVPLYEAGLTFNPAFLDKVEDFHTFRFMDWMATNTVFDKDGHAVNWTDVGSAETIDWADRPQLDDAQWNHGVPVEALVEIANRTGTDVWFNMPINASDDYVRSFATYVHDHLRSDLRIHVELSNEVWNWGFSQATYAAAQAEKEWGISGGGSWLEWYGQRAAQVGQIWKEAFGEPATGDSTGRVSMVFGTQVVWKGLEHYGLETPHWVDESGQHIRAADYFDEYAITGYISAGLSNDANVGTVKSWWSEPDGGYAKALAALKESVTSTNAPLYEYHASVAHQYGLNLVTYESGFGEATPPSERGDPAYTNFLINLQRRPEMREIELQNYAAFKDAGGTLYNNFGIISAPSKWGSWGALESVTQETSPRYDALTHWNETIPPWYELDRDAITFQNGRIYIAGDSGEIIAGTLHGDDVLVGGAGQDDFVVYGAGSSIDGRGGIDTVVFAGRLSEYQLTTNTDGSLSVTHLPVGTPDGADVLRNVEKLQFSDGSMTLGQGGSWHTGWDLQI